MIDFSGLPNEKAKDVFALTALICDTLCWKETRCQCCSPTVSKSWQHWFPTHYLIYFASIQHPLGQRNTKSIIVVSYHVFEKARRNLEMQGAFIRSTKLLTLRSSRAMRVMEFEYVPRIQGRDPCEWKAS